MDFFLRTLIIEIFDVKNLITKIDLEWPNKTPLFKDVSVLLRHSECIRRKRRAFKFSTKSPWNAQRYMWYVMEYALKEMYI